MEGKRGDRDPWVVDKESQPPPRAADIPFVRAMAKHGFNQLSNSTTPVDSMHFELRRRGTKKQ
jgi:hypothetical protein